MLRNPKKLANSMFWSGLHELISDFTFINDQYIVLEDTMTGYVIHSQFYLFQLQVNIWEGVAEWLSLRLKGLEFNSS